MFNLTNDMISAICSPTIYARGLHYLKEEKIQSVKFSHQTMAVLAKVQGSNTYDVVVKFDKSGDLKSHRCNCPAYATYDTPCKHIASVLLYIYFQDSRGLFEEAVNKRYTDEVFDYFSNLDSHSQVKNQLSLEPTVTLEHMDSQFPEIYLSLKIGQDKLYVVKNVRTFLHDWTRHKKIYFGQQFTFDPDLQEFTEEDLLLLQMLNHIYDAISLISPYSMDYYSTRIFPSKFIRLSEAMLLQFLGFYKKNFYLTMMHKTYLTKVTENTWQVPIALSALGEDLHLKIDLPNDILPLDKNRQYIYSQGLIYNLTKAENQVMKSFLLASQAHHTNEFHFSKTMQRRFISDILPYAEMTGTFQISQELSDKIIRLPLKTEIYLDKNQQVYTISVVFLYGDHRLNPYHAQVNRGKDGPSKAVDDTKTHLIVRDIQAENQILDILKHSGFAPINGILQTKTDNVLYQFVTEMVPQLKEHAQLYYSEAFKNIKIRSSLAFTGGVRLNEDSDLLEFDFQMEGVDASELHRLLNAIQEKKKFFKLHNGDFLNLESEESESLIRLMDVLNLSDADFSNGSVKLMKHHALALDAGLKGQNAIAFEYDDAFSRLIHDISLPGELPFMLPDHLSPILRPYQKLGCQWLNMLSHYGFGGILADDMGLGKTLQILTFLTACKLKEAVSALIIVPTSLMYNWQAELEKFTPELSCIVVSGDKDERGNLLETLKDYNVVITSYPLIRRDIENYTDYSFDYCILDEAQHIKNPNSMNAKCVKSISCKRRFALTGTPMENNLSELWSLFDFVMPGYLYTHARFTQVFETPIIKYSDRETSLKLSKLISPFVLRRLKKEVLKELPEKIENKLISELTAQQKKIYMAYLSQAKGEIEAEITNKGFEKSQIKILAVLTRLRQICCHPALFIENYHDDSGKLLQLEEIIMDALEGEHRILLFSQFTSMLKIIATHLDMSGYDYFYLDGSVPATDRRDMVKQFNAGERQVFLISLKAGGTGLNLTGADMVIHYDPWWNPAVEDQATDRAYRIGQEKTVQVIKMITKGTIEEKIFELQTRKKALIDHVIQPGETMISKLSRAEIEELFF